MQAIVQSTYGTPDVLTLADVAPPTLGERDVLVAVHASDVTQGDRRLRSGDFPGVTWLPGRLMMGLTGPRAAVPGTTFAGRVTAVGPEVTRFQPGDDVFGGAPHGAHAELLAVPEDGPVARIPADTSYESAATLPYGALTALVFLRDLAQVRPGQRVCVVGASGGVGRYAVQLARHLGAEVTAVCSQPNHALVRSLGAQHVVDYRTEDFRAEASQPGGRRYDVIFDTIGATRYDLCRRVLTEDGRYLSLIVTIPLLLAVLATAVFGRQRALTGVALPTPALMEDLSALMAQGALRPTIDRTFPLAQAVAAHAHRPHAHGSERLTVAAADGPQALSA